MPACVMNKIYEGPCGSRTWHRAIVHRGGHISAPALETFQAAFRPRWTEIVADVANHTDVAPNVQISKIVVGQGLQPPARAPAIGRRRCCSDGGAEPPRRPLRPDVTGSGR